mmetsp:Transcript_18016/g.42668  ORF Transcript_18016/g.42668 Transcript_18016/m.42668 type:complete len:377 (+) Transcript_18016:543-1673(+)
MKRFIWPRIATAGLSDVESPILPCALAIDMFAARRSAAAISSASEEVSSRGGYGVGGEAPAGNSEGDSFAAFSAWRAKKTAADSKRPPCSYALPIERSPGLLSTAECRKRARPGVGRSPKFEGSFGPLRPDLEAFSPAASWRWRGGGGASLKRSTPPRALPSPSTESTGDSWRAGAVVEGTQSTAESAGESCESSDIRAHSPSPALWASSSSSSSGSESDLVHVGGLPARREGAGAPRPAEACASGAACAPLEPFCIASRFSSSRVRSTTISSTITLWACALMERSVESSPSKCSSCSNSSVRRSTSSLISPRRTDTACSSILFSSVNRRIVCCPDETTFSQSILLLALKSSPSLVLLLPLTLLPRLISWGVEEQL